MMALSVAGLCNDDAAAGGAAADAVAVSRHMLTFCKNCSGNEQLIYGAINRLWQQIRIAAIVLRCHPSLPARRYDLLNHSPTHTHTLARSLARSIAQPIYCFVYVVGGGGMFHAIDWFYSQ